MHFLSIVSESCHCALCNRQPSVSNANCARCSWSSAVRLVEPHAKAWVTPHVHRHSSIGVCGLAQHKFDWESLDCMAADGCHMQVSCSVCLNRLGRHC